jgi:signal transduction histidine kinase
MRAVRERHSDLFDAPGSAREEKLRLLATASQVLAGSFELAEPLRHVAQLAVARLADLVLIDLLGEKGDLSRVAVASAEAGQEPPPSAPIAPEDLALLRRVLSSGRPILVGRYPTGGAVLGSVGTVALGAKSLMLLPLMSSKGPVGVLTLVSTKSARRFAGSDLTVAEDLAARIGTAIERAQLYNEAREAVQARQDILAFVSHDLKNSRDHEIGVLFQDAVELSAPLIADKRIEIKIETPPAPFKVRCDRERMMQVFSNLIGNAVKFVPERGTIVLSAAASGASALVAVRDTGPGIPPARLPHLFQRYWQADETARKGRGLGLFITKGIVEAQGGVIWAESQVGTGSTFFITLPLITPIARPELVVDAGKRPARRAPARLNSGTRTRIRAND